MARHDTYEESLPSTLIFLVLGIMVLLAAFFLALLGYQVAVGPVGADPAPNWYFAVMFLVFAGTSVLVYNLRRLDIRIDDRGVRVRFGVFRQEYAWGDIISAEADHASWFRYGGWGIRFTRVEGYWRRGYTVIDAPRVVLTVRRGYVRQFAFSTKRPEDVLRVIGKRIAG